MRWADRVNDAHDDLVRALDNLTRAGLDDLATSAALLLRKVAIERQKGTHEARP